MNEINPDEILRPLRREIDRLDKEIVALLAARFDVVKQVGRLKAKYDLSPVQPARMVVVLDRVAEMAAARGLSPDLVRGIYSAMIDHAHDMEFEIKHKEQGMT